MRGEGGGNGKGEGDGKGGKGKGGEGKVGKTLWICCPRKNFLATPLSGFFLVLV